MKNRIIFIFFFSHFCFSQNSNLKSYLPDNYVVNGSVDYTSFIQLGLDENKEVTFPDFPILINENGLNIKSNQILNFPKGSVLIMKPNAQEKYGLLNIINVRNVTINNPTLIGDRDIHLSNSGEWGMGINVLSSKYISILNPHISKFWGDGIYIGEIYHKDRIMYNLSDYSSSDIKISSGIIDHNRRNGISIISVRGITIENTIIQNTIGTMPMAGICIEPNNNEQYLENINIKGVVSINNSEVGIKYVVSNFLGKRNKNVSILIENFEDIGSKVGLYVGGARYKTGGKNKKLEGTINIVNSILSDNEIPIRYGSIQKFNPLISISSFKIFKNEKRENTIELNIVSELNKKGFKVDNK